MPIINYVSNIARLLLGIFLSILLIGCGSLYKQTDLNLSLSQIELIDVPFFAQSMYQCGPAALATVFQFRNQSVWPDELVNRVYTPQKRGSLQIDMVSTVRQQGLMPYPLEPSMQALLTEVGNGNPILVMQNLSFNWLPVWHYAVVVGFDLTKNEVLLRSGKTKRLVMSMKAFERSWLKAEYWALIIVEPNKIPQMAHCQTWLKTAFDLEQTGQLSAALSAYQTGFKKWPESIELGMALANLYYAEEDYSLSSKTFERLSRTHTNHAMVWNNWAYALKALNCEYEAMQTAQCAAFMQPHDKNIQSTLSDMQTTALPKAVCPVPICPAKSGG